MAKYVLLTFDNDAEADAYVESLLHVPADVPMQVRAVFKKPTKPCTCTATRKRAWTRGRKYGWYVCTLCGKPSQGWIDGEHWYATHGVNLLPRTVDAPEYRGDGNWSTPVLEQARKENDKRALIQGTEESSGNQAASGPNQQADEGTQPQSS